MSALVQLKEAVDAGGMPDKRIVWLGLGITPPKFNSIKIEFDDLPTDDECLSVAGLDVVLTYCGDLIRYSILWKICKALLKARPRRLQIVDLDTKRVAFLKLGAV
ncbi:hypothetical protein SAMN04515620_10548 [Collimonas sp. OK607]|uniref:hypothetical protein n=1 Tax=Collimonas sp. OK607 TaxID=1798194 RepID=UPI0008EF042A|nr:hypothetical protein [Collimonas sp. OK607]SFA85026.1 hypothetical protein SAMN04515620_10548 [Collimonas sp. OK607]